MKITPALLILLSLNAYAEDKEFINQYESWQSINKYSNQQNEIKAIAFVLNKNIRFSIIPDNNYFTARIQFANDKEPFKEKAFRIDIDKTNNYEITITSDNKGIFQFDVPSKFIGQLMRGTSLNISHKNINGQYVMNTLPLKDSKNIINSVVKRNIALQRID